MTPPGARNQGVCEWCEKEAPELHPLRDWEEHGSFSPRVYRVCPECVEKHRQGFEAAADEWAAYMEKRYRYTEEEQ
jgi:hypothetical protein